MIEPTEGNILECAEARWRVIVGRGGTVVGVAARALRYASRPHHPAKTAQEAVAWAIADLPSMMD